MQSQLEDKGKIAIILGTRPEIIKLSPIIRHCESKKLDYFIIHTNQHYSETMDKVFFDALKLPQPKYSLGVGSGSHGKQTGDMLMKIEQVLMEEKPSVVLVQGDTNTVLAGALAARKLHIKVSHIEAGLRSYDERMPEEANRIMTDHISDFLFVPTENQKEILLKEGISEKKIHVVGNTIVDAVLQNTTLTEKNGYIKDVNLEKGGYFLVTIHRTENVDHKDTLADIFKAFDMVYKKYKISLYFPMHPRTKKMIELNKIEVPDGLVVCEPVDYLKFLELMNNAKLILTDSGGIQEEACILKTPCITLRISTERPETLDVGSNILAGTDPDNIIKAIDESLNKSLEWENPFGDGTAAKKILDIIGEKG